MTLKKLIGLLAVSSLTLAACQDQAEDPAETEEATEEPAEDQEETEEGQDDEATEEDSEEETDDGEGDEADSQDTFDKAAERTDGDAVVPVGLEVLGEWTNDGYVVTSSGPQAEINLNILPDEGVEQFYVYITDEDGTILDKAENEVEYIYSVDGVEDEIVLYAGTSEEDLGEVDDTVDPEQDFVRNERIIIQPGEEVPEEEEEV